MCGVDRSRRKGFCGLGGEMLLGRVAPHLWEEPPISGTRGTGALFFSGCTLRCVYCQNGEISHRNAGKPFSPAELADAMKRLWKYPIVGHVHDEVIVEADNADEICRLMGQRADWLPGLKLRADGYTCRTYRKE